MTLDFFTANYFSANLPQPTKIAPKDRKYLEGTDKGRFLSEKGYKEFRENTGREVLAVYNQDPAILEKDTNFVRHQFNEIFEREKILVTNLKRVWNPYNWTHEPAKNDKGEYTEGLPIEYKPFIKILTKGAFTVDPYRGYRFILVLPDPKELRNIKLRRKRHERRDRGIIRECKECQKEFRAIHRDTEYCSNACKMRDYRKRKKES